MPEATAPQEGFIIVITSVAHALCHAGELLFAGLLLTWMSEFNLGKEQVTQLGQIGLILFGVGALPAGLCTDRWGSRRVLIVYFFALAATALTVSLAPDAWTLALALTGLGAALSLYHPAGLAMLTHTCRHRGRALGINGVAGNFGIAGGPALGLYFASLGQWRMAYVLLAVLSLLGGVMMFWLREEESAEPRVTSGAAEPDAERVSPHLVFLFAAMLLGGLNYRCLMTALPTFLSSEGVLPSFLRANADLPAFLGTDPSKALAALVTFVVLAVGGVGQYVGGRAADRVPGPWLYVSLVSATVLPALVMAHTGAGVVPAAMLLAVCLFAQQPVENTILAQATPPRRRSTYYGLKFTLTFGVGALGAGLVGIIWEQTNSMAPVFDVFAVGATVMASLVFCFGRFHRLRRAIEPRENGA